MATTCRAPQAAQHPCTRSCCRPGVWTQRRGLPSSTCSPSWRTTSPPQNPSTSLGMRHSPFQPLWECPPASSNPQGSGTKAPRLRTLYPSMSEHTSCSDATEGNPLILKKGKSRLRDHSSSTLAPGAISLLPP